MSGGADAFILKFNNIGNRLWASYYGGSSPIAPNGSFLYTDNDSGRSICVDANGNVFVTGNTVSTDILTLDPGGGAYYQASYGGGLSDAFILKFDNNGILLWATYYGGSDEDVGNAICNDLNNNVFVAMEVKSANVPTQNPGAGAYFQGSLSGSDDVFILKFSNNGNRLWATYYGGSSIDHCVSISSDSNGNVVIFGYTTSTDLPVQSSGTFFQGTSNGNFDAFILKFSNSGTRLWATYFGDIGAENDFGSFFRTYDNLAIDNCDNIYVTFGTDSPNFQHLFNIGNFSYFVNLFGGGGAFPNDIIVARFTKAGNLNWCTYLGGNGTEYRSPIAIDINNNL